MKEDEIERECLKLAFVCLVVIAIALAMAIDL
jgi:hypothetical protein